MTNDIRRRAIARLGAARSALNNIKQADREAERVRCFIEPLIRQGHTYRYVATWLNARRVVTPTGKNWHAMSVWRACQRLGLAEQVQQQQAA